MNYIKSLQYQVGAAEAEIQSLKDSIDTLRRYINLPKFRDDTTVQVSDIHLRLDEMISTATNDRDAYTAPVK